MSPDMIERDCGSQGFLLDEVISQLVRTGLWDFESWRLKFFGLLLDLGLSLWYGFR
jgi:hypothetical protein